MKILLISVVVALGVGAIFQRSTNFSEQANAAQSGSQQAIASTSQAQRNVEVMLRLFRAVESHDEQSVFNLYQPDVEFCWPPSLPYGGSGRGRGADKPSWGRDLGAVAAHR